MKNKKQAAATGIIAATLAFGGAGIAMAASGDSAQPTSSSDSEETRITGTVQAPPEETAPDGTEVEMTDAEEAAALEGLATITPEEAEAAALAAVPGTASEVELDDEDGFVVYEIEVNAADGSVTEVLVDAGDGSVLAQEAEDADDANEADEADDDDDASESNEATETGTPEQSEAGETGTEAPGN